MSSISPDSLLDLTVDVVARNYESLCDNIPDNFRKKSGENYCYLKLVFKNGHSLPLTISERLLHRLTQTQMNTIGSDILRLFLDPKVCPLRRFCVAGDVAGNECYSKLYWNYVEVLLKRQKLIDVEVRTTVNEFYQDYSDSIIAVSLRYLTISPVDSTCIHFITTFTNLKQLDVSNSNVFGDKELLELAFCLPHLESLDVSSTNVETVDAFGLLRLKLRLLYLHNTPLICIDLSGILQFSNLEFLDISRSNNESTNEDEGFQEDMFDEFLTASDELKSLVSFDISGAGKVDNDALNWFVVTHPKLVFLGLLNVDQNLYSSRNIPKNVQVTGKESLEQVVACLRRYKNRPSFLIKALKELFGFLPQDSVKHDVDQRRVIVKLLLDLMTKYMHKEQEDLQTAASACLFGCVRYDKSEGPESLHISIISDMVSVLIRLLTTYPDEKQIQRNCVIILYNNYILSAAKFDRYLVSKLIFKAISLFSESNIMGIVLDMCAYLSSKISVEGTLMLGTFENIQKLLSIIDTEVCKSQEQVLFEVGELLQCGLRFLWNLTDEAPATCHLVMNLDGHSLVITALQEFDQKNDVLTKLLGILNNLAEVVPIQPELLEEELMSLLRKYLDNGYQIDVCYFAAGIICNLVNSWPDGLRLPCGTRAELLSLVGITVKKWKNVDNVVVGYRTFKSFIPLLRSRFPDAQLWAIWAIYHVCSHKEYPVERYGTVCKQEGIVDILRDLSSAPESRLDVKNLAMEAANAIENTNDDNFMTE